MFAALLSVFAVQAPATHACSCIAPEPPQESLAKSAAVFSGKVTLVKSDSDLQQVIAIDVTNVWKGVSSNKVALTTAKDSAACGVNFEEGKEYIIYAYNNEDGDLATSLCSRTHEVTANDEDITALGAGNPVVAPTTSVPVVSTETLQARAVLTWVTILSLLVIAVGGFAVVMRKKS